MTRKQHREYIEYITQIGARPTRRQVRAAYRRYRAMLRTGQVTA